jgi:tetratricopeptide (TPR) repeat protein
MSDLLQTFGPAIIVLIIEYFLIQPLRQGVSTWLTNRLHLDNREDRLGLFLPSVACLFVTAIAAAVLLWLGYPAWPVAITVSLGGVAEALVILWLRARDRVPEGGEPDRLRQWKRQRRWAFLVLPAVALLLAGLLVRCFRSPPRQTIILVADFARREGAVDYDIGATIRTELQQALGAERDIVVQPLPRVITESGGPALARRLGTNRKATIVIWGWYGHGEGAEAAVWVSEHFELLRQTEALAALRPEATGAIQVFPLAELNSFALQRRLSTDAACVTRLAIGLARASSGNWAAALTQFDNAVLQAETAGAVVDRHYLYFWRGTSRILNRDFLHSIDDLTEALHLKPDFAPAYANRGIAYAAKGDLDRAFQDFDQAIRLQPDFAVAYYNRGVAYGMKGDLDHALQDYDKAINLKRDYTEAYYRRGGVYGKKGDHDHAIQDYDQALRLKPDFAEAYNNRGEVFREQGELDRAIRDYDQALRLKPDFAEAYYNRGLAHYGKGDLDRAIQDYDQALRLKPDLAWAYNNRGIAYYDKGDLDRALQDYTVAVRLQPDGANAYSNRALAYERKGDRPKAIADFRKVLELTQDPALRATAQDHLRALGAE